MHFCLGEDALISTGGGGVVKVKNLFVQECTYVFGHECWSSGGVGVGWSAQMLTWFGFVNSYQLLHDPLHAPITDFLL